MNLRNLAFWMEKNGIHNFGQNFDEKWANGQLIARKNATKIFHIHWLYHNVFTVVLKERMPIIIGT